MMIKEGRHKILHSVRVHLEGIQEEPARMVIQVRIAVTSGWTDCPLRDLGKFQGIRNVPHLGGACIGVFLCVCVCAHTCKNLQIVCLRYVCFTVCMVYRS